MKIQNIINNNGNKVRNQFIITSDKGRLFKSYDSAIALIDTDGIVHLSDHWDYSPTTSKYRNIFLNETTKETQAKIETGVYKMDLSINGEVLQS